MSSRDVILQRLRSVRWAEPSQAGAAYTAGQTLPGDVGEFVARATAAGAQVERVAGLDQVQSKVTELIRQAGLQKLILADDAVCLALDRAQIAADTQCQVRLSSELNGADYRDYVVHADLGITGCRYALAETGTVVLEHGHANERLVSHAPNHYICIVEREKILNNRFELAEALAQDPPKVAARTLITGVSRTADVALQIVLGMHGPRQVTIFIVE